MKNQLHFLFTISSLMLLCSFGASAQAEISNSMGQPLMTKSYVDVQGSPFLTKDWVNGMVKMSNGDTFKDVPLKYNEVDDVLYFKDKKGEELMFVQLVSEFMLPIAQNGSVQQHHFRNGYAMSGNPKTYYEVLSDGGVQLLKKDAKIIQEDKEYNSATSTQRVVETVKYYLLIDNKLISVKKDKKSILNALGNKQQQLETYLSTNNLNLKDDNDLAKLITYYNSI